MSRERTYTFPPTPPPKGWPCPRCHGVGNMGDGSCGWGRNEDGSTTVTVRESTKCSLCLGSGRVECTPVKP
jgi:hypothetical protein